MDRSFYVYCFCLHFVSWLPLPESETPHVFYKQRWILIVLCWRLNRLIYWWPSKSKINEVYTWSNVTLYSYRGISAGFYNHYSLNHPGKLSTIHLIKHGAAKGKYLLKRSTKLKDGEPKESYSTTDQRDQEEDHRVSELCHRLSR